MVKKVAEDNLVFGVQDAMAESSNNRVNMSGMNAASAYTPDYFVSPGEILEETLKARGIPKADFARRVGLSPKTISLILAGKAPILPDMALQFERVLGVSAELWTNLEAQYRLTLAECRNKWRNVSKANI